MYGFYVNDILRRLFLRKAECTPSITGLTAFIFPNLLEKMSLLITSTIHEQSDPGTFTELTFLGKQEKNGSKTF